MEDSGTSKFFIPYMSQFRATFQKALRSIKKRIETKASANPQLSKKDNMELPVEGPLNNAEAATQPMEPATQSNRDETALDVSIDSSSEDPDIGNKQRQRFDICTSCWKGSFHGAVLWTKLDRWRLPFKRFKVWSFTRGFRSKSAGTATNCCWQESSKLYILNRKHF